MPISRLSDPELQLAALENLRTLLLAASLPSSSSIRDLCEVFVRRLRELLEFEVASVYLKTTRGTLDRIATMANAKGLDHRIVSYGDGTAALDLFIHRTSHHSGTLASKIDGYTLEGVLNEYRDLMGGDFTVERVALRGSSQVFGMVELACGRSNPIHTSIGQMSAANRLMLAASALAGAITTFRSRNETMVLAALSRFLSDPEVEGPLAGVADVFNKALQLIVDGLLDYRAAVLRVATDEGALEVRGRVGDPHIKWENWKDHIVRGETALCGEVLGQKDRIISVSDIAAHEKRFVNFEWTVDNGLRSCISCPLVARGKTVGTVTFYTGFQYKFSELDEALLWCFAARFAAYWDRYQALVDKAKAEAELDEIRYDHHNRLLESARQAAVRAAESQLTGLLHESKGTYTSAILLLDEAHGAAPTERLRLIERCLSVLKSGEQRLDGPQLIDLSSSPAIDLNAQIHELVQQRNQWKRERKIGVSFDLTLQPVPLISMSEEDVIEVIENLVSNSIRSIRSAGRKRGEIRIATGVVRTGDTDELEIVVQDNGTGVRRDLQDDIFEKGFTTYGERGGTGLGLYLVRSIISRYNGKIRVESQYGAWARFIIRIPVSRVKI